MPASPLSDTVIRKMSPAEGQIWWKEITDGGCPGLKLMLSPRGEKVWMVRLVVGKKRERVEIGAYPAMSLSEAREEARRFRAYARGSGSADEAQARLRAMTMTVEQAHQEYCAALKESLRASTLALKKTMYQHHIGPLLGRKLLRSVRRQDVNRLVLSVVAKGKCVQANRVFSEMMALLRWAERLDYVEGVPSTRKQDLTSFGAAKEMPRTRHLKEAEIQLVWRVSEDLGSRSRDLIRLILLTAQRRDEVRLATWDEIDLERALWVIPAERYKTKVAHAVPLSPPVVKILRSYWSKGAKGYVLTGLDGVSPFLGQASALRRLRKKMGDYHPFHFHDLRRTARTEMSALGVNSDTAERVIGHLPPAIVRVYDLYEMLPEKRVALNRWAEHVLDLGNGSA